MSEWIRTKDKLPRVRKSGFSDYVMVYHGGFNVRTARIRNHNEWRGTDERAVLVRYWMPLPPLPEEDSGQ